MIYKANLGLLKPHQQAMLHRQVIVDLIGPDHKACKRAFTHVGDRKRDEFDNFSLFFFLAT
jgi:hypothetical protein